jgi:hypothetical protein
MNSYSGEHFIWSLAQAARAAAVYPYFPATWQGLEALQARVAMGDTLTDGPKNFAWARTAFADAEARFDFKYEQVPA